MKYQGFIFEIRVNNPELEKAISKYSSFVGTTPKDIKKTEELFGIHSDIRTKCLSLYKSGAHAEAVEKSFKVVKDRLRELTGYENGSDAFGKGKLYIKGASAPNVESDFNKAVQFLMMAIDMFRNEKSHTSDAKIEDPVRSYQYLAMSSLAMSLLDNSMIIK